jgi:hypothetical protein
MPTTLPQLMGKILVIERVPSGKGQKQSQNAKVQGFVSLLAEDKLLLRYVVVHSAKRHRLGATREQLPPSTHKAEYAARAWIVMIIATVKR